MYDFTNLIKSQNISAVDTQSNTTYFIQLCGNQTSLPPGTAGCDKTNTGVCRKRSNEATAMTVVKASHKFVITSHAPHTVDIHYDSGSSCGSDDGRTYEALVSLQCSTRESSTMNPIFQREEECTLYFVWQNSSFCVEEESCSTVDVNGNIYNLDGLFAQTWTVSCGLWIVYLAEHKIILLDRTFPNHFISLRMSFSLAVDMVAVHL